MSTGSAAGVLLWCTLGVGLSLWDALAPALVAWALVGLIGWSALSAVYCNRSKEYTTAKEQVVKLAAHQDVASIGVLLESLSSFGYDSEVRSAINQSLVRVLHRVDGAPSVITRQDLDMLDFLLGEHSRFLYPDSDTPIEGCGMPREAIDVPLVLAILSAFRFVGGERHTGCVRRLARLPNVDSWQWTQTYTGLAPNVSPGRAPRRHYLAIKEAALACLPLMEARGRDESPRDSLLRPASADDSELLRPVSNSPDAAAEQLLRSASGPGRWNEA